MNQKKSTKRQKRPYCLQFKVSNEEKSYIEDCALKFGGSISEYLRAELLQPQKATAYGQEKQALAKLLCRHAQLINQIHMPELRKSFVELEVSLWQLTK